MIDIREVDLLAQVARMKLFCNGFQIKKISAVHSITFRGERFQPVRCEVGVRLDQYLLQNSPPKVVIAALSHPHSEDQSLGAVQRAGSARAGFLRH